jgi:hypothetical protein
MTISLHRVFGLAILYFVPQEGNSERTKKRAGHDIFDIYCWMDSWPRFTDLLRKEKPVHRKIKTDKDALFDSISLEDREWIKRPNNRSNRFEVANQINARLSSSPKVAGQFWCASPAAPYRYIPQRRLPEPFQTAQRYVVKALRLTDRRARSGSPRTTSVLENGLSVSRASAIIGPCAIHMCPSACLCGELRPTNQP